MTPAASVTGSEIEVFRCSARTTHKAVRLNAEGITQEESLIQPRPAGNCLNWVVGHLLRTYDGILPLLGQQPVMGKEALRRYARGTPPLGDPAEALPLRELLAGWDKATERVEAGLATLAPNKLDAPAPMSPTNDPRETVRSLLAVIFFHQAYHAGQMGILRRLIGKEGAIR